MSAHGHSLARSAENSYSTARSLIHREALTDTTRSASLVGTTRGFFPLGPKPDEAYTSLKHPKPKGADVVLNRNRTQSIAIVERQVNSIRSTFSTVNQIINDKGLEICGDIKDRAPILKEWRNINDVCCCLSSPLLLI